MACHLHVRRRGGTVLHLTTCLSVSRGTGTPKIQYSLAPSLLKQPANRDLCLFLVKTAHYCTHEVGLLLIIILQFAPVDWLLHNTMTCRSWPISIVVLARPGASPAIIVQSIPPDWASRSAGSRRSCANYFAVKQVACRKARLFAVSIRTLRSDYSNTPRLSPWFSGGTPALAHAFPPAQGNCRGSSMTLTASIQAGRNNRLMCR